MIPGISIAAGLLASAAPEVNPVNISNENASKTTTDGSAATASFTFGTDRTVKDQDGANLDADWLQSGYNVADYQIRVTVNSGTTPSGSSVGTWLSLSSNRTWSLTDSAGASGTKTCNLTVEIRDAASPNTVRDSATYTLTADSQAAPVNVPSGTYEHYVIDPTDATCNLSFLSSGGCSVSSEVTPTPSAWGSGVTGADYWIRWTNTSGTLSTGTAGTWQQLNGPRTFGVTRTAVGDKSCTGTVEIATDSAGTNVVASGSITLTATVDF